MRVADVDEAGRVRNLYPRTARVGGREPELPYAVYLADRSARYRLLAFDLDMDRGPVGEDLAQLRGWLAAAGIPHLVARSGPGESRHVWAAIAGGAAADVVAALARSLAERLPTLDIAPLTNPISGCVRPPGAPHRAGGRSTISAGELETLTTPQAGEVALHQLLGLIGPPTRHPRTAGRSTAARAPVVDDDGHRRLPGQPRALPTRSRVALERPLAAGADPSAVAWTVLLGAVRARWRHRDVLTLLQERPPAQTPGLEHLRTERLRPGRPERVPRPARARVELLARQWDHAVSHVAAHDASNAVDSATPELAGPDGDSEFTTRLGDVLHAVAHLQARADATPGRWARPGGGNDRRVLDHACQVAAAAVRAQVALDIRSVAIATGLSRETARYALQRLHADSWLSLHTPSVGPQAATWALPIPPADHQVFDHDRGLSTSDPQQGRSHVVPPPEGGTTGPAPRAAGEPPSDAPGPPSRRPSAGALQSYRRAWLQRLHDRISAQAHDVFTGSRVGGLGDQAGRVYAVLEPASGAFGGGVTHEGLIRGTGLPAGRVRRLVHRLAAHRLARRVLDSNGRRVWVRGSARHRTTAARALDVHGVLARRRRQVLIDRRVWAWWLAELDWMHSTADERRRAARTSRRRRPGPGQGVLPVLIEQLSARQRHGPYPRDVATGRGDHTRARQLLAAAAAAVPEVA